MCKAVFCGYEYVACMQTLTVLISTTKWIYWCQLSTLCLKPDRQ